MAAPRTDNQQQLRRRRRRAIGTVPAAAVMWGILAGLPVTAGTPRAGTIATEIITLTGPAAQRTASATSSARSLRAAPDEAVPGWSAALDVENGSQAVAVSWIGAPQGAVEVRGSGDNGWTDWTELASDPGEAPDDAPRSSGGMAWFGRDGIDDLQVRVASGDLADLEVQTIRYDEPSAGGGLLTASAGATAAQPAIQPRSTYTNKGWATSNPGCASGPVQASGGVKYAVVHHTVNSNTYAAADVPAMLAAIYTYHTGTNRWCDVGYNFLVDRFGRIWEGRSGGVAKPIVGGHAAGFNTGSTGVSFLGQHEPGVTPAAVDPSSAALTAAGQLIGWKLGQYGIDPTGTVSVTSGGSNKWPAGTVLNLKRIIGHRDVGYSACPGQRLYDRLASIRTTAKAAQGQNATTTTTTTTTPSPPPASAPFRTVNALVTQQYVDVLRRQPAASDLSFWSARVGTSWTPGKFIAHLTASAEADDRVHAVTRLYRAYFLRNPDHSGFTYWMNRRGEGRSLLSISNSFAESSEFKNRYGNLSNAAFVDRVYRNVLGRPADPGGSNYWTTRLNGKTSRGQVMANFSQSSEFVRSTEAGVRVVAIYEAMLRRAPAPDVYIWFENGLSNSQNSLTGIATYVYDGGEYRNRFR